MNAYLRQTSLRKLSSKPQYHRYPIFIFKNQFYHIFSTNCKKPYILTHPPVEPDDDGDTTQAKMADQYYFGSPRSRGRPDAAVRRKFRLFLTFSAQIAIPIGSIEPSTTGTYLFQRAIGLFSHGKHGKISTLDTKRPKTDTYNTHKTHRRFIFSAFALALFFTPFISGHHHHISQPAAGHVCCVRLR